MRILAALLFLYLVSASNIYSQNMAANSPVFHNYNSRLDSLTYFGSIEPTKKSNVKLYLGNLKSNIPTYGMFFLAGIANGFCDVVMTQYDKSIFKGTNDSYFDPRESWKSKWKNGDPNQGPKFFLSTSTFSAFTDFWHMSKTVQMMSISIGTVTYRRSDKWWVNALNVVGLQMAHALGHTLVFNHIGIKGKRF